MLAFPLVCLMKDQTMSHTVVLIPGDGIGPEVSDAVRRIFAAANADIQWIERYAGVAALQRGGDTVLPQDTIDAILQHGVALKGPCTTPIGGGFSSINVALRKKLNLYGAVRPVRSLQGVKTRYQDVDLIVVRENTEGLYSGIENIITPGVITSLKVATEEACRRIANFAFSYAISRGRKKVTVLHKANIMKLSDGLFIQCAKEEHERSFASQVLYEELIIDAACMRLVQNPGHFDVILCENLYGDLISDLCAGLVGGLGVTPGANFGEKHAVFEAVHGSAPDIAGQNIANPLALLMSGVMMLRHLASTRQDPACQTTANRIRDAYNACLDADEKTRDLGGSLSTTAFADAVIARLK
jgi:isocitrate dehydrogenase (NAD+)